MATAVGLNMKMTADTSGIGRGMTRTETQLKGLQKAAANTTGSFRGLVARGFGRTETSLASLQRSAISAAGSLKTLVAIQVGGIIARGFARAASAALGYANSLRSSIDETAKLARRTGIAVEALQGFQVAADLSGVQNLEGALQRLTISIGDAANGVKEPQEAFDRLGLSFAELQTLAPEDQFRAVAAAISDIPGEAERAAVAADLFGRTGVELLPLFASNLEEVEKRANRLGLVLSQDQTSAVEEMNDALSLVQQTFDGIIGQVTANLAPAITALAEEFLQFVEGFQGVNGEIGGTALADAISDAFFAGADYLASILDPWIVSLLGWGDYFGQTASELGGWFEYFQTAVELLQAAFYTVRGFFNEFVAKLADWAKLLPSLLRPDDETLDAFADGLRRSAAEDRQLASDAFMGRNRTRPDQAVGPLQSALAEAMSRRAQRNDPEARAEREQERLFSRLNESFAKANDAATKAFGEDLPAALTSAAAEVENLIVSAVEDGTISSEEVAAITAAQEQYNDALRIGTAALTKQAEEDKKREQNLKNVNDKILAAEQDRDKRAAEIAADRLDALSRRSNEALNVSDVRSGGISEVLRIATGREDPAIEEYRKQLSELRKIEQRLRGLEAEKVAILG